MEQQTEDNQLPPILAARVLAARCKIIELELQRLEKGKFEEKSIARLISDTHKLSLSDLPRISRTPKMS